MDFRSTSTAGFLHRKAKQSGTGIIVKTEKTVRYAGGDGKEYAFISNPYAHRNSHSG